MAISGMAIDRSVRWIEVGSVTRCLSETGPTGAGGEAGWPKRQVANSPGARRPASSAGTHRQTPTETGAALSSTGRGLSDCRRCREAIEQDVYTKRDQTCQFVVWAFDSDEENKNRLYFLMTRYDQLPWLNFYLQFCPYRLSSPGVMLMTVFRVCVLEKKKTGIVRVGSSFERTPTCRPEEGYSRQNLGTQNISS